MKDSRKFWTGLLGLFALALLVPALVTILMLAVKGQRLAATCRADLHRVLACLEAGDDLPALRRQGFFGALPAAQQLGARKCLLLTVKQLKSSNDAFEIALLQQQVRDLCNQLGTSVPPLEWIGRDPRQQPLPGV